MGTLSPIYFDNPPKGFPIKLQIRTAKFGNGAIPIRVLDADSLADVKAILLKCGTW